MSRTRALFVVAMCCAGLFLAAAVATWPPLRARPVPILLWLVLALALVDLAALSLRRFGFAPATGRLRLAGVVTGAVIFLLADMAFTAMKAPLA
jgi:hypothetical protein